MSNDNNMKLEELKNWSTLTPEEQARLKKVYGDAPVITKTMAEKPPETKKEDNG